MLWSLLLVFGVDYALGVVESFNLKKVCVCVLTIEIVFAHTHVYISRRIKAKASMVDKEVVRNMIVSFCEQRGVQKQQALAVLANLLEFDD